MKKGLIAAAIFLIFSQLIFCQQKVRLGLVKGICSAPFIFMINTRNYEYKVFSNVEELVSAMKAGTIDVSNVPAGLGEKIVAASKKSVEIVGITSTTDIKLISTDANVTAFSDLLGKKVYVPSNTFEDRFIRYLLSKNEIPVKQDDTCVDIVNTKNFSEIVSKLSSGKITCGILPEPYVSNTLINSPSIYEAIDLQDEYVKIVGPVKKFPKTVMIVLRQFKNENKDAFSRLEGDVLNSINSLNSQPLVAAKINSEYGLGISSFSAAHGIKKSRFCFEKTNGKLDFEF